MGNRILHHASVGMGSSVEEPAGQHRQFYRVRSRPSGRSVANADGTHPQGTCREGPRQGSGARPAQAANAVARRARRALDGRLKLFRNHDDNGTPLGRPRTLLIDSEQLESGDALDADFRNLAADEIERFRYDIVQRTGDARAAAEAARDDPRQGRAAGARRARDPLPAGAGLSGRVARRTHRRDLRRRLDAAPHAPRDRRHANAAERDHRRAHRPHAQAHRGRAPLADRL